MDFNEIALWGGSLVAASMVLVSALKALVPGLVGGKEPHIAVLLYVVGGISLKASEAAFGSVEWAPLIIGLLVTSSAPGALHDKTWNPFHPDKRKTVR